MLPDAECIKIMTEVLSSLDLGEYSVKINHRKLLDGIFAICGVPEDKFRTICSSVDKLDKTFWEDVKAEMIDEKGLDESVADAIGKYIAINGRPTEVIEKLKADAAIMNNSSAKTGVENMELLVKYCNLFNIDEKVLDFNLSLARGLDYYTGVIYEAILISKYINIIRANKL